MIFEICISIALFAVVMAFAAHLKSESYAAEQRAEQLAGLALHIVELEEKRDALTQSLDIWKETVTELSQRLEETRKQLDELDPQAGVDAAALEKAFNEGVQRIMDYSLSTAMGGKMIG